MDLKTRFFQSRLAASSLSAIVSAICGVAIIAFGAPPAILILASWATITVYAMLSWPNTPTRR
ncbi:MAG TPA: hypothetical protein VMR96_09675 [Solirubrobacterales bacterium]|nr:hypothetical protein [Solirubrobacterales bacterium]